MLFQGKGSFFPGFRGIFIRNLFFLKQGVYPGFFALSQNYGICRIISDFPGSGIPAGG